MKWYSLYDKNKNYLGDQHAYTPEDAKIQCWEITDKEPIIIEETE